MFSESEAINLLRLRYFQHQLNEMLKEGQFKKIPIHLAFGHEAVAVGIDDTLGPDDLLCVTHRNAAYNLARSKSLDSVLRHYLMNAGDDKLPQMASMNLAAEETNIAYASSILGNNLPVAAGIAMNRKLSQAPGAIFVATGDGAMEEGVFWETLIFSKSHSLGLVIIVENNDCSMSSTISQRRSPIDLSLVCEGLSVLYYKGDGALLSDVKNALISARNEALKGRPTVIEFKMTTFCNHAGATPGWPDDRRRISLKSGLLIPGEDHDPLKHLLDAIGLPEFQRLSDIVTSEDSR